MMNLPYAMCNWLNPGIFLISTGLSIQLPAEAADSDSSSITVRLGDYRFSPDRIELSAGTPVRLLLINTDGITPHNFTLKDEAAGLDINMDVSAGETKQVEFVAQTAGTYYFFCNKKLPLLKSHRDRGMQGSLAVSPSE